MIKEKIKYYMDQFMKRKIYKKWWFWVIVIVFLGIGAVDNSDKNSNNTRQENNITERTENEKSNQKENEVEKEEPKQNESQKDEDKDKDDEVKEQNKPNEVEINSMSIDEYLKYITEITLGEKNNKGEEKVYVVSNSDNNTKDIMIRANVGKKRKETLENIRNESTEFYKAIASSEKINGFDGIRLAFSMNRQNVKDRVVYILRLSTKDIKEANWDEVSIIDYEIKYKDSSFIHPDLK